MPMRASFRLVTALNAGFLLAAVGCGDEGGGCGPAPENKGEASQAGGASGNTGSPSRANGIEISDKKGKVPKQYQRPPSSYDPAKSTATISKLVIAVSTATAAARKLAALPVAQILRRRVDGVADRVEVSCRIMAASSDGRCASAANYSDIKARCCPEGLVERCRTTMSGVVLIGRGCNPAAR